MESLGQALARHLDAKTTTLCRAWALRRRDGVALGFTDHDCDLHFEVPEFGALMFRAGTGLTARSLSQSTGLSVDNGEALGALSAEAVREADIEAGRYDGAEVRAFAVNWAAPDQRAELFRGTLGEIRRANGQFEAELRGLTEALNRPLGRIYQKACTAVLGDGECRFDMATPGYRLEISAQQIEDAQRFVFDAGALGGFDAGWFDHGRLSVLSGAAQGLWGAVRADQAPHEGQRAITLWQPLPAAIAPGDLLRLEAGCDKALGSCRLKFDNIANFQGFPDIPGEDWLVAVPRQSMRNSGGSRR